MANTKISALTADTAPTADDLVVTVNDPGGTPATRKATITNFTKAIPAVIGDSGSGGTKGLVPAPGAGDAAAGKFLKADGTFAVPSGTTPGAHASTHQNGGGDEIDVSGLSGVLADPQIPITENVQDIVGAAIVAGTGISVSYNDGTGETTVTNTATGGSGGFGDVVGPGSSTDNALARFDSTTGKLIQNSTVTLDDTGAITVPEMAAPSTPASGKVAVYAKSDGKLYIKDDAGTETDLTATGGGGGTPGGSDTQVQYNNSGAFGGITNATSDGTTLTLTSPKIVTGLLDTNGNPFIAIAATASAVDGLTVTNSAAGSPGTVDIATTGSDTNINLTLSPKGTGQTLSSKVIAVTSGGTPKVQMQGAGLANASASAVQWSNGSSSAGTIDLGLARNAAGIIEINSGSSSTYRWLKKAGQVRLAAQFDKTNTTLADVTGTSVALLSGQTYAFEFEANYDADATGGQKWAIAYSSTTSAIEYHIKSCCDASGLLVITSRQTASAGAAGQAGCTAGRVRICGTLTTTGAGNLTVQFAQNAASGTSSVRTGGSFFRVWPTTN